MKNWGRILTKKGKVRNGANKTFVMRTIFAANNSQMSGKTCRPASYPLSADPAKIEGRIDYSVGQCACQFLAPFTVVVVSK